MEHKERNESIRLKMLDEIADIEAFSKGRNTAELTADKMWQKAVVMSLINIGELSKAFTEDYLAAKFRGNPFVVSATSPPINTASLISTICIKPSRRIYRH